MEYKITVIVNGKRTAEETYANIVSNLEYDNVKAYVTMQPLPPKKKR